MKKNNGNIFISFIIIMFIVAILLVIGYLIIDYIDIDNNIMDTLSNEIIYRNETKEATDINFSNHEVIKNPLENVESSQGTQSQPNVDTLENYYYNQLDSNAKKIYDKLLSSKQQLKTGQYEIDFGTQFSDLLNSTNGVDSLNMSFQSALMVFEYSNPEVFYLDITKMYLNIKTTTKINGKTHVVTIGQGSGKQKYLNVFFSSTEQIEEASQNLENLRENLIGQLEGSTENKIKQVHDCLIDNFDYEETAYNCRNIYGAFVDRKVVCEGYAKAFKYILDGMGIENIIVVGKATNSSGDTENHAWNYVKIGSKWYGVDVTWDDPIIVGGGKLSNSSRYKYFLKGADVFNKDHEISSRFTEDSMEFVYPTI